MSRPDARRCASTRSARLAAALLLATSCALGQAAAVDPDDDRVGELMGDLMFHADLLVSLERLCPGTGGAKRDWQAVVRQLPSQVRTRELRELSLRLSANAGVAMLRSNGGCGTRDFVRSYENTRREYDALLEQWARLSV